MSNKNLGSRLKELREKSGLTLRQVEETTSISNAYLSQLENNKIKKPSANCLYKLANLYGTNIDDLLYHSGLIEDKPKVKIMILSKVHETTTAEEQALLDYLKYLRNR